MTRTVRSLAVILSAVLVGMALMSFSAWSQPVDAGGGCVDLYTVQRGDTLYQISRRSGIPISELWLANRDRIANPNRIYVGQVLCLPAGGPMTVDSKMVLEVWYRYTPSSDETKLQLPRSGELSKRVELRLLPTQPVTVYTLTHEITQAMRGSPTPLLVGMRTQGTADESSATYTLIAIGTGALFDRLVISGTLSITPSVASDQAKPVQTFLQQPGINEVGLFFWLEAEDGTRMPFYISGLDVVSDYVYFEKLYLDSRPGEAGTRVRADDIAFVLFPATRDHYHIILRLSADGYGPPSWTKTMRCDSWRNSQGWWFWYFQSFYGCSG